jgi:hypothetical protein
MKPYILTIKTEDAHSTLSGHFEGTIEVITEDGGQAINEEKAEALVNSMNVESFPATIEITDPAILEQIYQAIEILEEMEEIDTGDITVEKL